jgi:hypothetical protein
VVDGGARRASSVLLLALTRHIRIRDPQATRAGMAAATLPPNSLIARKMFLPRMKHVVAATLAPHAFRATVPAAAAEASPAEASFAFRATKAAENERHRHSKSATSKASAASVLGTTPSRSGGCCRCRRHNF